jgi:hypothetical protein
MFLAPLALIGLALLVLPVIVHALKRGKAKTLEFPTLEFIRETSSFRLRLRRIQHPLLLALRLIALTLLVFGFARLIFPGWGRSLHARVILIDSSLSMGTAETKDAASEQVRKLILDLPADEETAIVRFSSEAVVLCNPTTDKARLAKALDLYTVDWAAADFDVGVNASVAILGRLHGPSSSIDLISDFQASNMRSIRKSIAPGIQVKTFPVGRPAARNDFINAESVSRSKTGIELRASEILTDREGRKGAIRAWPLSSLGEKRPDVAWETGTKGELTGVIHALQPDDFDGDDDRYFAFDAVRERRALLIDSGTDADLYFQAALESAGTTSNPVSVDREAMLPAIAELGSYQLVILTLNNRVRAQELDQLSAFVAGGGTLWMLADQSLNTEFLNDSRNVESDILPFARIKRLSSQSTKQLGSINLAAEEFQEWTASRASELHGVKVSDVFEFEPQSKADVLIRWATGEPSMVGMRRGKGKVLFWPFSLRRSSSQLGVTGVFPLLVSAILDKAASSRSSSLEIGQPVDLNLDPDSQVRVAQNDGLQSVISARELMQHPLKSIPRPGIYRFEFAGGERTIAFNTPALESEIGFAGPSEVEGIFKSSETASTLPVPVTGRSLDQHNALWSGLLGCAFIFLMVEMLYWMRARRRTYNDTSSEITEIA